MNQNTQPKRLDADGKPAPSLGDPVPLHAKAAYDIAVVAVSQDPGFVFDSYRFLVVNPGSAYYSDEFNSEEEAKIGSAKLTARVAMNLMQVPDDLINHAIEMIPWIDTPTILEAVEDLKTAKGRLECLASVAAVRKQKMEEKLYDVRKLTLASIRANIPV